ncbi:MAG TPA: hypothetical protein VFB10_07905 [Candidatus Dormibacteraeota bacterium]|nr:hypothetical protein [Candidatus Dormibacteraeota bacterium]
MATNYTMWILKGTLLGLWLFGFGTMAYLYFAVYRHHMRPNTAVSINLITWYTTHNPLWWTALVVCLALGYAIVRWWPAPAILWVAVLVTGLVPAGWLALFLAIVMKLKHVSQSP